jgi:hypothetical protein
MISAPNHLSVFLSNRVLQLSEGIVYERAG